MVGSDRSNRSRRRWQPTLLTSIIALAAQACSSVGAEPGAGAAAGGTSGASASGGGGSAGGPIIYADPNVGGSRNLDCPPDANLLADQAVTQLGSQRVLYSWTTDEQVAELRAGGPLFSRSERPDQGRGLAMTRLTELGAAGSGPSNRLAATLSGSTFAKMRFSWPNPWATLMGWPGETYGNQLLRITLRPEAWIAIYDETRGLSVRDSSNQLVDIETAAASPERIGAIYFQSATDKNITYCGTFSQGAVAFREFVLGNLQMVQSWELATPRITERLLADIAALEAFSADLDCRLPPQWCWADQVASEFSDSGSNTRGSLLNYDRALGIPSELYFPSSENLAAIVAALKVSMPQGEPLVVNPGG